MLDDPRNPSVIDRNAVLVGVVVELALLVTGAGIPVEWVRAVPWLGAGALASVGLVGGAVAGGLVDGPRRIRAIHGGLCGTIGGFVFALWLYYTLVADVYLGAFYGLAYAIATIGIPPELVARFDALLPLALGVGGVFIYTAEGALAGAIVPPGWIEPPPVYPS